MKPVRADFATRLPILRWAMLTIAISGFAVAALQIQFGVQHRERALGAEKEASLLQQAITQRSAPTPAPKGSGLPYLQDALAIARIASYDFGQVLTSLETVQVPNIKVSSIEIVTAEALARVDVEFTGTDALLQYLEKLNGGLLPSADRWKVARAQLPTATTVGTATIVAPSDIGRAEDRSLQQKRR